MKNLVLILLLLVFSLPAFAEHKPISKDISEQYKQKIKQIINEEHPYVIKNIEDNIHVIKIKNKTYTCYNNNCYDFGSLHYNKLTKTYTVDMIMDLMWCNAHQEYKSPFGDGYISHLIFKTKLFNNEVKVKCTGFVVGDIVTDYKNGRASSAHYNINSVYEGKPTTIADIKEFENILLDKDMHILIIKNLANNLKD